MGISTKVAITGEKEYRQALSNINAGLNVLKTEMAATTAKFQDQSDSTEALKSKQDVLNRSLLTQQEKLALMREQLNKTAQAYGEGSENTMKMQTALNKAEKEMYDTEAALKKVDTQLTKTGKETKGLGDALSDLGNKFGIKLPQGITTSLNGLGSLNPAVLAGAAAFAAIGAAIVEAEKKLISWAKKAASSADEVLTLSKTTGMATSTIQEFQYAAELLDVDLNTISGSLTKLTVSINKVAEGNESTAETFNKLGIRVQNVDGSLRSSEEVFYDAIDALGNIGNETERDALAMELFGKSAKELNPLIEEGSKGLNSYKKEANDVGFVLDTLSLNKLGKLDDSWQRMNKTFTAFKTELAVEFAPYLEEAIQKVTNYIRIWGQKFKEARIGELFGQILELVLELSPALMSFATATVPVVIEFLRPLVEISALLADTFEVLVGILTGNTKMIRTGLGLNIQYGEMSHQQQRMYSGSEWTKYDEATGGYNSGSSSTSTYNPLDELAVDASSRGYTEQRTAVYDENGRYIGDKVTKVYANASGDDYFSGGWTWVGEKGPELINLPQGSQIRTAQESRQMSGDTYNISINASSIREFEDIIRIVKQKRTLSRMGV